MSPTSPTTKPNKNPDVVHGARPHTISIDQHLWLKREDWVRPPASELWDGIFLFLFLQAVGHFISSKNIPQPRAFFILINGDSIQKAGSEDACACAVHWVFIANRVANLLRNSG
jgi:hypothetical protein